MFKKKKYYLPIKLEYLQYLHERVPTFAKLH